MPKSLPDHWPRPNSSIIPAPDGLFKVDNLRLRLCLSSLIPLLNGKGFLSSWQMYRLWHVSFSYLLMHQITSNATCQNVT